MLQKKAYKNKIWYKKINTAEEGNENINAFVTWLLITLTTTPSMASRTWISFYTNCKYYR